ncbi:6-carboxytetrahydropterin synthase [Longispora sp. NPDC051575]|uniref:6-carboxytetrahydropterin synthase n=1 Tax=Longispora sp. NPDC051575 TaxID=3154943 RepID=UPI003421D184
MGRRTVIGKDFTFSAGHHLPSLPDGHKCRTPHGHNYTVTACLTGKLVPPGFVTDFADLAPFKAYLDTTVDHKDLNTVFDFEPTSELLAAHFADWFVENVQPHISGRLVSMSVSETTTSWAEVQL